MDIKKELIHILSTKSSTKHITENTELKALGIDSLDLMQLLIKAEEKYDIRFNDDELLTFKTVNDVIEAIKKAKK